MSDTLRLQGAHDWAYSVQLRQAEKVMGELARKRDAVLCTQTAIRLGVSNVFTMLAPYIFMKGVQILDACHAVFDDVPGAMSFTHPSAMERSSRLRTLVKLHAAHHRSGALSPVAIQRIDDICHRLGSGVVSRLRAMKMAGHAPRERIMLRVSELGERPGILGLFPSLAMTADR